ncbi:MAG: CDP-alcohol phosphatidyltransferase family protein, partial [Candidatus Xenobia bacterium]
MNVANAFTVGNLYCGFLAAICTIMGHGTLALLLLLAAFFCDGLDGYFARKHQSTSDFGERL